mgnify:CR=1 FL=1
MVFEYVIIGRPWPIGYWTTPYFLWFHHTLYGGSVHVSNEPYYSPLEDQEQGNGDGGTFPQPWEADRPPPHLLCTSTFTPLGMVDEAHHMVRMSQRMW